MLNLNVISRSLKNGMHLFRCSRINSFCCTEVRQFSKENEPFTYVKAGMEPHISKGFDKYSVYRPAILSLEKLLDFGSRTGTEMSSFEFLRQELPVRLANIMKEINLLPEALQQMPSVITVRNWYQQSFAEILDFETFNPKDAETLPKFAKALVKIRNRHTRVVETMAEGIMEMKSRHGGMARIDSQIQYFLDRFYTNRISIRMLINQHALLYGSGSTNPRHIGCIDPHCDVLEIVTDAYNNARFLCEQYYLTAPDLQVESFNPFSPGDSIKLVYVPSHLYHMLFELFKNAMRAVVETHTNSTEIPPLRIKVCKGHEDLTIKLSDQGGGIPYSKIDLLFQYMYTSAPQPSLNQTDGSAPLAGYGYGLPLSRLYARYFQGDLILTSMDGHGTDAIIYLKVLSDEANECLPVYNKTASRMYASDVPISDWSSPAPWSQNPSRSYSMYINRNHRKVYYEKNGRSY